MSLTVEQICDSIGRFQLMSSRDLEAMRSRWFRPGREDVSNTEKFRKWIVTNHFLTPFAIDIVCAGKGEQLVLNDYRVRDQIKSGPLAGAYLATNPLLRSVVIQIVSRSVTEDRTRLEVLKTVVNHGVQLNHPNVCHVLGFEEARGTYYVVREHDEATTLADILQKRNKLPYEQAAKIFALASEGLRALHDHGVPGGILTADCVLLAATAKDGSRSQRTVRLLVAAVRKEIFDANAITPSSHGEGSIPDDIQLANLTPTDKTKFAQPTDDILRLGCLFYRCLTGKDPYPVDLLPNPTHKAVAISELAPDVPATLAEIVEEMIDPDPARRPKSAGHVAKAIRVFLRSEEDEREVREEEQVVLPRPQAAHRAAIVEEEPIEAEVEEEEEETPRRPKRRKHAKEEESNAAGKLKEVWEELRPEPREWVYLGVGAALMIVAILLLEFISGIRFVHVVLLTTGAALTFLVERLLRWWEHRQGESRGREPA